MIGSTLGEYQIVRLLGRGGMGAVYEALQGKIGRRVALKVLLPEFATNPELIERFFNEAVGRKFPSRSAFLDADWESCGNVWRFLMIGRSSVR